MVKAENVKVNLIGIGGINIPLLARSLVWNSANQLEEDRRFQKAIGATDYTNNSAQRTSVDIQCVMNDDNWGGTTKFAQLTGETPTSGWRLYLSNTLFASGGAVKSVTISVQPFSLVEMGVSIDIHNPTTGQIPTGTILDTSDSVYAYAHGLYSTLTPFEYLDSISSIEYQALFQREPRYILGSKIAQNIVTKKASQELSVVGFGNHGNLTEQESGITLNIGTAENSTWLSKTISGKISEDRFEIPEIGIVRKTITITQNLL